MSEYLNNIYDDPLFADTFFNLSENSPCIDAGNPDSMYNDPEDPHNNGYAKWPAFGTIRNDIGATGGSNVTRLYDGMNVIELKPKMFVLYQNYPNPFNPKTMISYQLQFPCFVELKIYNVLGRKVAMLVSERQNMGIYNVGFNATNFSSGIYFYRLITDNGTSATRKLVLVR